MYSYSPDPRAHGYGPATRRETSCRLQSPNPIPSRFGRVCPSSGDTGSVGSALYYVVVTGIVFIQVPSHVYIFICSRTCTKVYQAFLHLSIANRAIGDRYLASPELAARQAAAMSTASCRFVFIIHSASSFCLRKDPKGTVFHSRGTRHLGISASASSFCLRKDPKGTLEAYIVPQRAIPTTHFAHHR